MKYLTYGVGASALITTRPNQFRKYKIVDHLGTTRVVLDSNGAILSTYDFEPFGKPLTKTGLDSRKSIIEQDFEVVNLRIFYLICTPFLSIRWLLAHHSKDGEN